jgi:hypothetical protein
MTRNQDGPRSPHFTPLILQGNAVLPDLVDLQLSGEMAAAREQAPRGSGVSWGIPFEIGEVIALQDRPVSVTLEATTARWLVFLHTSDVRPPETNHHGFISPMHGQGRLGEHAADYVIQYADGSEARAAIRRRHQVGAFTRRWGENCFEAVAHHKAFPLRTEHEQRRLDWSDWGSTQTRVTSADFGAWVNWLWAWENPHPDKAIVGLRFEPVSGLVIVSAVSAGSVQAQPLRWLTRRKACLTLPEGEAFQPDLDEDGLLKQIQLDLGQVISATPRPVYPNETWPATRNNLLPEMSPNQVLIEYTAHPEACFHLWDGQVVAISQVESDSLETLRSAVPADQTLKLRVIEQDSGKAVAVKLHVHGEWGEYLTPVDRHRILNPAWFEDYSVDFAHLDEWSSKSPRHSCTYIPGETTLKLPLGKVYVEVSKGFEIKPVRQVIEVTPGMQEIVIEIEKVLPWRKRGWVTADTHVHFLSPMSALLEGAAEGVNIVNLLASQWGELMTNVGDFDGKTTWGSPEAGGDGEHLVRVGTENRQHVLGHISLLGYRGPIIAPMTTGGPDESALGDPIEVLLTDWARQCKWQGGLVVLPHFPNPRAEHAASIVSGEIDAVEMTSWHDLYSGIDPYSLSDWYRYLNCGYRTAAVAGTDKMTAATAVGTVRTYARIAPDMAFTYEAWKEAVRRAETFVTYGPLMEFDVDGYPMGGRIDLSASGGTVDVTWQVASTTIPMSRVELVMNGEIRESVEVSPWEASGSWRVGVDHSAWLALLVRGHYTDKPEVIAAHGTPVMVMVEGSPMLAAADAVTILEQIEGAMIYLDTVGTRPEDRIYKRMRLSLESSYRALHNRMHQAGHYHEHTPVTEHAEHREKT